MLFNSHEYVFVFLPIACAVFLFLAPRCWSAALTWLTVASLAFYAWWNPANLAVLLVSLGINYVVGCGIDRSRSEPVHRAWLLCGILGNVAGLVHFKYAAFLVENWNLLTGWQLPLPSRELPLGISFFTFQQIAYLCDIHRRRMAAHSPLEYGLFVSFFPQLIAGPIVRPDDVLPQFRRAPGERTPRSNDIAIGVTLFALGLFKKTVIADGVAGYASPVFACAEQQIAPTLLEAWGAALAYALQLYYDFSGYSDMAIGSARLFGIRLPQNFNSPYQATSISDFWRRWHMTLSLFLRDFIYVPLGGSRCASWRRSLNLFLTMLLGGLWHGAGWTYIAWGALHGVYLVIDHAWQRWRGEERRTVVRWWARPLTFLAVVAGWVLFRAPSFPAAISMYAGMLGLNGVTLPDKWVRGPEWLHGVWSALTSAGIRFAEMPRFAGTEQIIVLAGVCAFAWWAPNTAQWLARAEQSLAETASGLPRSRWGWSPTAAWGMGVGLLGAVAILRMTAVSEFVYFQF